MAGPTFRGVGARVQSAGATTLTPTKPTVDGANGLLVAVLTTKNNSTPTTSTTGWTKLSQTTSGASFIASVWTAPEGSANPVFTWTGSVACSAQIAYYSDAANTIDTSPLVIVVGSGLTSTHSTLGDLTNRNNSLVIYIDVCAANTALASPGAGWTEDVDAGSATDAGRTVWGSEPIASSGTTTDNISVTGGSAAWVQWQIEIMGSLATAGAQFDKLETGAWLEPPAGATFGKAETGVWLEVPDGGTFVKVEVGLWLETNSVVRHRRMSLM